MRFEVPTVVNMKLRSLLACDDAVLQIRKFASDTLQGMPHLDWASLWEKSSVCSMIPLHVEKKLSGNSLITM